MMGSMDFWIIGSSVTLGAQGVLNQALFPFPAFLLSLWSFRPVRETIKKPNEFAKIQVNPTKSDQIKPLFLFQLLTPEFWLLNSGGHGSRGRHVLSGWVTLYAHRMGDIFQGICLGKQRVRKVNGG